MSKLNFEAAVANHGGAMEAETIKKNGRSSKSQMSSRNVFGMNKFIALFALTVLILSGCSHRLVDFTIISSKNHSLAFDRTQARQEKGTSMGFLGMGTSIKAAMDKALEQAGREYDLLIDGVVYAKNFPFVSGYEVRGLAVSSAWLRAELGNEGFQNWLAENNVFDPASANVQD